MEYDNTFNRSSMDLSTKKVISAGLVFIYALSLAMLVPMFLASNQGVITAVINPATGGNCLPGRYSGIVQASGVTLTAVNLTYVPPFNTTLPLKVCTQSIFNGTLYYYNSTGFNELVKKYGISMTPVDQVVNVTSKFFARTTEPVFLNKLPPYNSGNCYLFNTTPPTPFYYSYRTLAMVNSYFPNTQYINTSSEISDLYFNASYLPYNTKLTLSIYATPALPGIEGNIIFNFSVKLCANSTTYPDTEYTLHASFYFNNSFICELENIKTSVPGVASATSPTTIQFTSTAANYILLVDLGLWSNVSTVYVTGVEGTTYPSDTVATTINSGSFHPVIIPPAICIQYKTFYSNQINPELPNTSGPYSIPYMIANVTIYAPDDMLNWTYAQKYVGCVAVEYANPMWNPYCKINEAWCNNYGHGGNGLTVTLIVGNNKVVSTNFPYLALCHVSYTDGFHNFVYKFSIEFLLSCVDNITYMPITVKPNSTGLGGDMLYVLIKPCQLKDATILLTYNDSDYAVQHYFGPVDREIAIVCNNIKVYTPLLNMPKCVSLSTPFINGQVIDYDYGYNYALAGYVNTYYYNTTSHQYYKVGQYVYIQHVSGDSELLLGVCPGYKCASLSIYYPNVPPYYPASHEAKVGKIMGIYIEFANGTMERIYLSPSNITALLTTNVMKQMAPMPPFWNYSFEISITGLESILHITPNQALTVLNNSYIIVCYYDMASNSIVHNMTKLVSTPVTVAISPPSQAFYYAPATPFNDIVHPGCQIFYFVNVNATYPITVTLTDKSLGELSPTSIVTTTVTCIYVILYNGTILHYNSTVFPITLTETAPSSGVFTATLYVEVTNSKGTPVTAYPLNYSYIAIYNPATKMQIIVGKLSNIMPLEPSKYFKVGVVVDGLSANSTFTLTEIPNVIYNVTPIIYNYIDGELSVTVAANIPGYYYSGYLVLTIYNCTAKPCHPIYTYQIYFNFSTTSPYFVAAYDLLFLEPILNGHTYYITITAIVVPLTYEPFTTIGFVGKVFSGEYYFSAPAGS
ncbi:s-layer glycosylated protein, SlaA [Acidianus hospitalis W1]|uniref:S-layer glycosylated protein, SlaA n=1 Tax=Acidianus hospitalis (strain W1) TaxID=933801 RepID=F4B9A9_ACIHW|nr:hypothetical protein [Acidianus hospitalis]AEE93902.1 s-layer glycosylated protein, SlaA [Acidianus hospitalis W1]